MRFTIQTNLKISFQDAGFVAHAEVKHCLQHCHLLGHQFKSWLLYLQSSFLLLCLREQWSRSQIFGSLPDSMAKSMESLAPFVLVWISPVCQSHVGSGLLAGRSLFLFLSILSVKQTFYKFPKNYTYGGISKKSPISLATYFRCHLMPLTSSSLCHPSSPLTQILQSGFISRSIIAETNITPLCKLHQDPWIRALIPAFFPVMGDLSSNANRN